ncbi:hypothetical protein RN001_004558 [Aquatica leii]|uniref:acid phosphatase n=1 Tax=Aquatica leii TaxID=1421715 RepID=A0AAN7PYN3_9COLE|nr:hypothetical protein RN001_004558 [Aquatica leii]
MCSCPLSYEELKILANESYVNDKDAIHDDSDTDIIESDYEEDKLEELSDHSDVDLVATESDYEDVSNVMFRHGFRTNDLVNIYPKDPYRSETYYPYGYGQLTNQGKMREYNLGELLNRKYSKFLGMYVPEQVDAWTTDTNRTKMSLLLVLAALYPPNSPLNWNNELNWQPIPYNIIQLTDHRIGVPQWICKRHALLYEKYKQSDAGLAMVAKYTPKYDYVSQHSGMNVKTIFDLYSLYFALSIEKELGFVLPEWTDEIFPAYLENATIDFYVSTTESTEMTKLTGGFMQQFLVDTFTQKISNTMHPPDKKIIIYSAHEFNIAVFLRSLNVFTRHFPPYGSCVMLELHLINGVYGIKLFHQDWTTPEPKLLTIPGCGSFCPFEQFKNIISPILARDSSTTCNQIDDI